MTVDGKKSLLNMHSLKQPIHIHLSMNEKTFFFFFFFFSNFNKYLTLWKKADSHSVCISEITHCERRG